MNQGLIGIQRGYGIEGAREETALARMKLLPPALRSPICCNMESLTVLDGFASGSGVDPAVWRRPDLATLPGILRA